MNRFFGRSSDKKTIAGDFDNFDPGNFSTVFQNDQYKVLKGRYPYCHWVFVSKIQGSFCAYPLVEGEELFFLEDGDFGGLWSRNEDELQFTQLKFDHEWGTLKERKFQVSDAITIGEKCYYFVSDQAFLQLKFSDRWMLSDITLPEDREILADPDAELSVMENCEEVIYQCRVQIENSSNISAVKVISYRFKPDW